jgi:hypothetical protein
LSSLVLRALALRVLVPGLAAALTGLAALDARALEAAPLSAYGKGNDFSDPLDGVAEEVVTSTSTQDLQLNAVSMGAEDTVVESRGIYEFDVGAVAPDGVNAATLELPIYDAPTAVGSFLLYAYAGNGSLDLADYEERALLVDTVPIALPVTSVDVTAEVQSLFTDKAFRAGFLIALPAEDQLLSIWNPGASQYDPRLWVEPLPESGAGGGAGLLALGWLARRRGGGSGVLRGCSAR